MSQNWVEIESKLIQSWFIKSQNGVKVKSKWSQSWFKVKTNLSQSYWVKVESMLKNEFRKRLNFFNFLAKFFYWILMLIFGMKIQIFCNLTFKLHCYKMRLFLNDFQTMWCVGGLPSQPHSYSENALVFPMIQIGSPNCKWLFLDGYVFFLQHCIYGIRYQLEDDVISWLMWPI